MLPSSIEYRKADLDSFLPGELQSSSLRPKIRNREVSSSGFDIKAKKAYYSKINQKLLNDDYIRRNTPHYSRREKGDTQPDPFRPTTGSLALRTLDDTFENENKWQRRTMQAYVRATSPVTLWPVIQDPPAVQPTMASTIKNYSKLSASEGIMSKPFPNHKEHRHCVEEDHRGLSPMEKHNILPELKRLDRLQRQREARTASRPMTCPELMHGSASDACRTTGKFKRVTSPLPKYRLYGSAEVWENLQDASADGMEGFSQLKITAAGEPLSNLTSARFTAADTDSIEGGGFIQDIWEGEHAGPEETFAASRKTYRSGLLRTAESDKIHHQGGWYRAGSSSPYAMNTTRMSSITTPSAIVGEGTQRNSISSHGRLQGVREEKSSEWRSRKRVEWPSYYQPMNSYVNTSEGPRKVVRVLDHTASPLLSSASKKEISKKDLFRESDDQIISLLSSQSTPDLYKQTFEQRTKNLIEALT